MSNTVERAAPRPAAGLAVGVAAALLTVSIWAGWIVATRHAVIGHFDNLSLGLMRYAVPAVVFAPWWLKRGILPGGVGAGTVALMVAGAGAPFFLVVSTGMRFAPAADIAALLPGTMPVFVAVLGTLVFGERLRARQWMGFVVIALGVAAIASGSFVGAADGAWRGHLLFLTGAMLWALYTHAFRRSGLDARHAAAVIGVWSMLLLLPLVIVNGSRAIGAPPTEIAVQLAIAFASGVVALTAYGVAVSRLGASAAAAFSALVPALAAILAIPVLGEIPGAVTLAGIALVAVGVVLGSGFLSRRG